MAFKIKFAELFIYLVIASYLLGYLAIHGGPCSTCFIDFSIQMTPLHLAACGGHVDTVRCLVEQGADTNIKDIFGVSE